MSHETSLLFKTQHFTVIFAKHYCVKQYLLKKTKQTKVILFLWKDICSKERNRPAADHLGAKSIALYDKATLFNKIKTFFA